MPKSFSLLGGNLQILLGVLSKLPPSWRWSCRRSACQW